MNPDIPESELCARYSKLYTRLLTDVLEQHRLEDQTLDNSITPLSREMRTAGIAYPIVGQPNRSIDGDELFSSATRKSSVPSSCLV